MDSQLHSSVDNYVNLLLIQGYMFVFECGWESFFKYLRMWPWCKGNHICVNLPA